MCEDIYDELLKVFWFVNSWIVKELFEDGVYNALINLQAYCPQLLLYLLNICYIDDIIKDIIINILFNDLGRHLMSDLSLFAVVVVVINARLALK